MDEVLQNAIKLANNAHWNQKRKDSGVPYILHPMRVMAALNRLYMETAQPYVLAAAVCHDVEEDSIYTHEQIAEIIGKKSADLVHELTNPSKGSTANRAERKKMDREHLATVFKRLPIYGLWVWRIKLIDRLDNLKEMILTSKQPDFMRLYAKESTELHEVIQGGDEVLAMELLETIGDVRRAANLLEENQYYAAAEGNHS